MENQKFVKYCIDNLDLTQPDSFENYFASVPICAINAIYSINTKYQAVLNVIENFCNFYGYENMNTKKGEIPKLTGQPKVSEVYQKLKKHSFNELSEKVFCNRQRTSTTNGILKAEAVMKFLKILKDFKIETFQDVPKILLDENFELKVKEIEGQKSGVSLKYFFMLTGSKDQIKPDRMIIGFIKDAIGKLYNGKQALELINFTVKELRKQGFSNLTARHLDNIIWNFQRS